MGFERETWSSLSDPGRQPLAREWQIARSEGLKRRNFMDRRKFLGLVGSGIAASNLSPVLSMAQGRSEPASGRPNLLFIIADI